MFSDWEEFVAVKSSVRFKAVAALVLVAMTPLAALAGPCASADEVEAFRLRHLQSRLMVAGLSCGQRDAYNSFMTRHKPYLGGYGPRLIAYYQRSGGGQAALNSYVTQLANAAASIRSDDPVAFCTHTWNTFWEIEQNPAQLSDIAATNPIPAIDQPVLCSIPVPRPKARQKETATPMEGAAVQ